MRALAFALVLSVTGCAFAVKHPAITAGIVGGTVAFGTCELGTGFESTGTCSIIGGAAAVGLAGIVALAIVLGGDGHTVLVGEETAPPPIVREKKPAPAPAPEPPVPTEPPPPATPAP